MVLGIVNLKVIAKVIGDDPAGFISLSLMSILATSIMKVIADGLQKPLKNLLDTKLEDFFVV